jgi:hypothetical protein
MLNCSSIEELSLSYKSVSSKLGNRYNFLEIRAKHTVGYEYVKKSLKKNIIVTVNVFCYKKCQQGSVDPDLHV